MADIELLIYCNQLALTPWGHAASKSSYILQVCWMVDPIRGLSL